MAESQAFCCCWSALLVGSMTRNPPLLPGGRAAPVVVVADPDIVPTRPPFAPLGTTSITRCGYRSDPPAAAAAGIWTNDCTAESSRVPVSGRLLAEGCCCWPPVVDAWITPWWWWCWWLPASQEAGRLCCEVLFAALLPPGDLCTRLVEEDVALK